jgi:hypothetical protein
VKSKYYFITAALFFSLFIYLFYRTEKTVVNELVIRLISLETYTSLKQQVIAFFPLHGFMIYSMPEGLWVYCITLTSKPYYIQLHNKRIQCMFVPIVFCIGLEIFQHLDLTKGRFDLMDIYISFIFWAIGNCHFNDDAPSQNIMTPLSGRKMVCLATYGIVYLSHVLE